METRTLLTVIALLLAGIVTIMLARAGGGGDADIFTNNAFPDHAIETRENSRRVADMPPGIATSQTQRIQYRGAASFQ